jgi:hypothetical protein
MKDRRLACRESEGSSLEEIEEYHFVANQTFRSEDEAYELYKDYAKAKGFSIRKEGEGEESRHR